MAQGISLISGSPLIGSPIVYRVTPEVYAANRTFHRIIVRVYAKLETDGEYTTFDFSTPVETKPSGLSYSTQPSQFDISSALRAVADKYEYTPEPPERYPYIKFRIEAWDEWMVNGDISTRQGVVYWPSLPVGSNQFYGYAFMGAFNDMERMNAQVDQNNVEYLNIERLSRKPLTPEIVFINAPFTFPQVFSQGLNTDYVDSDSGNYVSNAPSYGPCSAHFRLRIKGEYTVAVTDAINRKVYATDLPANFHVIRFINNMGVMESVHVTSLTKKEVNIHTEKYTISRQETLKKFSRALTVKTEDYETWTLASGPLDEDWVSWYIHEFLMAQVMWISIVRNSTVEWVPCHVLPEETTMLRDTEKASMMSVQFRLQMDINGSLLP